MPAKKPKIPAKLWMLWSDDYNCWIVDSDGYCCFTSLAEAKRVAKRYPDEYDLSCYRVKVRGAAEGR